MANEAKNFMLKREKKRKSGKKVFVVFGIIAALVILGAAGWMTYRALSGTAETIEVSSLQGRSDLNVEPVSSAQRDDWRVSAEKPRYLTIPALNITNARVVELGVKANNQLDDPDSIHDAGWYAKSALPGSGAGALLIDGHNQGEGAKGIFFSLSSLKNGDQIIVERGDGQKFTYQVVEVEQPLLDDIDMAKMLQPVDSSKEGLNIITCSGQWNRDRNTFDHRTTVRAIRI